MTDIDYAGGHESGTAAAHRALLESYCDGILTRSLTPASLTELHRQWAYHLASRKPTNRSRRLATVSHESVSQHND